jgi:hypothetical protein
MYKNKKTENNIYLFCYGSNSISQIKDRLSIYDDIIYYPAHIKNYCRIFGGYSKKWSSSVASIYPLENNNIYGIIVKLNEKQIIELDKFEKGYTRKIMEVFIENKKIYCNVNVYIKNDITFNGFPSIKYLEAINSMLNNRYDNSNNNRKIMIRVFQNNKIVTPRYWTKENGIELIIKNKNI